MTPSAPAIPDAASLPAEAAPRAQSLRYQPEIDGLRAIAVLPVVLFHAGIPGLAGGFLGVDVFFVISGYLITSLVLRDISRDRFSVLGFYERRARRILPALIFVVLCTIPLAVIFLFPWQIADFGHSITATMGFYANQYFLSVISYFKPGADELPLLHMWSLAVEEQYYLLVPPALWLLWKLGLRHRALFALVLVASLLSLAGAVLMVPRYSATAFYILPTRAFELGIGTLLGIALLGRPRPELRVNGAIAAAGVAMILGTMLLLPRDALLPSWLSLVPCVGAGLVIAFATPGTTVNRVLASRGFVAIGLISFSLYLWHQPLLAFARVRLQTPPPALMAGLVLLSVLLASASWALVERPLRYARAGRGRVLALAVAGLVGAGVLGQVVALEAHRLHPVAPPDAQLAVSFDDRGNYVARRYLTLPSDFKAAAPGQPRLLLIGDSHSEDFYNMVAEAGAFPGWAIAAHYIARTCQVYFGPERVGQFLKPENRLRCRQRHQPGPVRALAAQADAVVIVAKWEPWAAERIGDTLAALQLTPAQKLVVVGPKGYGEGVGLPRFVGWSPAERAAYRMPVPADIAEADAALRAGLPAGSFVDFEALVCPGGACRLFGDDGQLLSHDGDHLTEAGVAAFAPRILAQPPLMPFRAPDPAR